MDEVSLRQILQEVEDQMVPHLGLDLGEARLWYHLFRHSRLEARPDVLVSVAKLAELLNTSKNSVKPRLRSMSEKGVIEIVGSGWAGTRLRVFLPSEIPGAVSLPLATAATDLESLDFYNDPKLRPSIIERDGGRCFYCRRTLTLEDAGIDHVVPIKDNGTNGFRNLVAACHSCNSSKCSTAADDFLRSLYRAGLLNDADLRDRLDELDRLRKGERRPIIAGAV